MGIVNQTKIDSYQYERIVEAIMNIDLRNPDYNMRLVKKIAQSSLKGNDLIIKSGVHFNKHDYSGPSQMHFNIQHNQLGSGDAHVYVQPYMVETESDGVAILPYGTVFISFPNVWKYHILSITTIG